MSYGEIRCKSNKTTISFSFVCSICSMKIEAARPSPRGAASLRLRLTIDPDFLPGRSNRRLCLMNGSASRSRPQGSCCTLDDEEPSGGLVAFHAVTALISALVFIRCWRAVIIWIASTVNTLFVLQVLYWGKTQRILSLYWTVQSRDGLCS